MNIYLVFYRINHAAESAAERELDVEHELGQFVRQQVGPGKSWVATERDMDEIFDILCAKMQNTGCIFMLSRDGTRRCVYPHALSEVFEDNTLTHSECVVRAKELFEEYLNNSGSFLNRHRSPELLPQRHMHARAA